MQGDLGIDDISRKVFAGSGEDGCLAGAIQVAGVGEERLNVVADRGADLAQVEVPAGELVIERRELLGQRRNGTVEVCLANENLR